MYVNPAAEELFYMRMLLNKVRGPQSFEDIRTIHGTLYPDFQSACRALGLLGDNNEWNETMLDAQAIVSAAEIRQLFVTIVMYCGVSDPKALLNSHWHSISDDILHRLRLVFSKPKFTLPDAELKKVILYELELFFIVASSSLVFHKLPLPDEQRMQDIKNKLLMEELDYNIGDLKQQHDSMLIKPNPQQKHTYHAVIEFVFQKKPEIFFIHGHGGTGKTFFWHVIIAKIRSEGLIVLAVASSGIASFLHPGGRTAHSRFKIPLFIDEAATCKIKKGSTLARLIQKADLIVWHEAPMNHKRCFEAVNKTFCNLLLSSNAAHNQLLFEGKPLLLEEDFRQILPVIPGGTRADVIDAALCTSSLWFSFKVFYLYQNMRLYAYGLDTIEKQQLSTFANWILHVGDGKISDIHVSDDPDAAYVKIPSELLIDPGLNPIAALVHEIYHDLLENQHNPTYFKERAIITPKNKTVSEINNFILHSFPASERVYLSSNSICSSLIDSENLDLLYPTEFLNQLDFPGLPTHELTLKIGTPIMLLRNMNQSLGLCNGTTMTVTHLADRIIQAKIITGNQVGDIVFIPRIVLSATETKWPFVFKRRQFPIRICYAMTIKKSQGQSLKKGGLHLPEPVFPHGQLYVALSRVTSKIGFEIVIDNAENASNDYAKNIVYQDVLTKIS